MKQLQKYLYIVLVIPLLVGFSQVDLLAGADCSQCMLRLDVQPSCCQNKVPMDGSGDCVNHSAASKLPCPHNELCQGDDNSAVAVATSSLLPRHMGSGVSSFSLVDRPFGATIGKEPADRPPPLYVSRVRYILLCSFLI